MSGRAIIFALAWGWWLYETSYFGWNASPGSPEELVCDGVAVVLFALSLVGIDNKKRGLDNARQGVAHE